jgi:hypothetical protein
MTLLAARMDTAMLSARILALSNGYIVDGLETNDPLTNLNSGPSTNLVLGLNSISEVTVSTLCYSVDQGLGRVIRFSPLYRYGENSGGTMHAEPHFRTSCHYQVLPLNPFLANDRVKRKDFPEIARPPWAQAAPGSNPGAPTKLFKYLADRSISLTLAKFNAYFLKQILPPRNKDNG